MVLICHKIIGEAALENTREHKVSGCASTFWRKNAVRQSIKRKLSVLLASVLLLSIAPLSTAEEAVTLGNYVYVPAREAAQGGSGYPVYVRGIALEEESGESTVIDALAGVELGIYVQNARGEMTPWANPLYPTEAMRVRTTQNEETLLALPPQQQFFVHVESVPSGYEVPDMGYLPLQADEALEITCIQPAQLHIAVADTSGNVYEGIEITVTTQEGVNTTYKTDSEGKIVLKGLAAGTYRVTEVKTPQGALALQSDTQQITLADAQRGEVEFIHPELGHLYVRVQARGTDETGTAVDGAYGGYTLRIYTEGNTFDESYTADELGVIDVPLGEGTYFIAFSQTQKEYLLPLTEAMVAVQNGMTTPVEITAIQAGGRFVLSLLDGRGANTDFSSVQVYWIGEEDAVYGPYTPDANGIVVSGLLPEGSYRADVRTLPKGYQSGQTMATSEGTIALEEGIMVQNGSALTVALVLEALHEQTMTVALQRVAEDGSLVQTPLPGANVRIMDANGASVAQAQADEEGLVQFSVLTGGYTAQISGVENMDVQDVDIDVPSDSGIIAVRDARGRVEIHALDAEGARLAGGKYRIRDAQGESSDLTADEQGQVISPLLYAGEATLEVLQAPEGYVLASPQSIDVRAGELAFLPITFLERGKLDLQVQGKTLNDAGDVQSRVLPGVSLSLLRLREGGEATKEADYQDSGVSLLTNDEGHVTEALEAGTYLVRAKAETLPEDYAASSGAVVVVVADGVTTQAQLDIASGNGGAAISFEEGTIDAQAMAQAQFTLTDVQGRVYEAKYDNRRFMALDLPAGTYALAQTKTAVGYGLAAVQEIDVRGGEVTSVVLAAQKHSVLSIDRRGVTFNEAMQNFLIPISGVYGIYTRNGGEILPYPDAENQMFVTANDAGEAGTASLPAATEGTVYFLREEAEYTPAGYAVDTQMHEVTVYAGQETRMQLSATADKGFFALTYTDVADGRAILGGAFSLYRLSEVQDDIGKRQQAALEFTMEQAQYQNDMALPVGHYRLVQTQAASGYALDATIAPTSVDFEIYPYLSKGGTVTPVAVQGGKQPQSGEGTRATIACADAGDALVLEVKDVLTGELHTRVKEASVNVQLWADAENYVGIQRVEPGNAENILDPTVRYGARVIYALGDGGWRWTDLRTVTNLAQGGQVLDLSDVEGVITAVKIVYFDEATGLETLPGGTKISQSRVHVNTWGEETVALTAQVDVTYAALYADEQGADATPVQTATRAQSSTTRKADAPISEAQTAGVDGIIAGFVFEDKQADGLFTSADVPYEGVKVLLMQKSAQGELTLYDETFSAPDGRYAFANLPLGTYAVQFELPENYIFAAETQGADYLSSAVIDRGFALTADYVIDASHTSHWANAGILEVASITGHVYLTQGEAQATPFADAQVSIREQGASEADTVYVSTTQEGTYTFAGLYPGDYELRVLMPTGYALHTYTDAFEDVEAFEYAAAEFSLAMGDHVQGMDVTIEPVGEISGFVFIDSDYDGRFGQEEKLLAQAKVELLDMTQGTDGKVIATTNSDAGGAYRFEHVYKGDYALRYTLPDGYVFTRSGEESQVSGAAGQVGQTAPFSLTMGEGKTDMRVGATIPASFSVQVWQDTNYDGLRAAHEKGLSGAEVVLVRLENGEETQRISRVTDESGVTNFDAVSPGNYIVEYTLPGVMRATKRTQDSQVEASVYAAGKSDPFVLVMGQSDMTLSIGAFASATIRGTAFADRNDNGLLDAGETGENGVTVELISPTTQMILFTTQTDEQGNYAFEGLEPGRYRLRFTAGAGKVFSGTDRTRERGSAPRSEENVSTTNTLTVGDGQTLENIHAGVVTPGTLSGRFYIDANGNGNYDDGEQGMEGAIATLSTAAGRSTGMLATSDAQGNWRIENVRPDTYTLRIALPEEYILSVDDETVTIALAEHTTRSSLTAPFELVGGEDREGIVYGGYTQGVLGGYVYADTNFDGRRAADIEGGLHGVIVELLGTQEEVLSLSTSDREGKFRFAQLMPGAYALRFTLPDGYVYTLDGDSITTRSDERTQSTPLIELAMGEYREDILVGALAPAKISGRAWIDEGNNGRREGGEPLLEGVNILLLQGENTIATTQTNASGYWYIDNIMPGEYVVEAQLAQGYLFGKKVSGNNRVSQMPMEDAQSAQSAPMELKIGDYVEDFDIGVVRVGSIHGKVYTDANYNGQWDSGETGVEGAKITLCAQDGTQIANVQTDAAGNYALTNVRVGTYTLQLTLPEGKVFTITGEASVLPQSDEESAQSEPFAMSMGEEKAFGDVGVIDTAVISGVLYTDNDFDNVFGENETGIARAVVELLSGGTVISTQTTQGDGTFTFERLRPGTYRVRIALPNECLFTDAAALQVEEGEAVQGETGNITLAMGQHSETLSFPAFFSCQVSGCAFEDVDVSGLREDSEPPLLGTLVELYMRVDGELVLVHQTEVDEAGAYRFGHLWPGQYAVRFTIPDGYLFTDAVTYDATRNSDAYAQEGTVAMTGEFVLGTGEKAEHADVGGIRPALLGDTVFVDSNANGWLDYGEPQLADVEIYLYTVTGGERIQVDTCISDAYGYYRFANLRPGEYAIGVLLPEGYEFTKANVDGLAEIDSDIVAVEGDIGYSEGLVLQSGEMRRNIDIGLIEKNP